MVRPIIVLALVLGVILPLGRASAQTRPSRWWVCASNEASGDVTIIDGQSREVVASVAVGKRLRGIHASPDGKLLYVALSGTPLSGPPQLDAQGNPILDKKEGVAHTAVEGRARGHRGFARCKNAVGHV